MSPPPDEPQFPIPFDPARERPPAPMLGPLLPPPIFIEPRRYGEDLGKFLGDLQDWIDHSTFKLIEEKSGGKVTVPQLEEIQREAKPKAILKGIFGRAGAFIFEKAITQETAPGADDPGPITHDLPAKRVDELAESIAAAVAAAAARVSRTQRALFRANVLFDLSEMLTPQLLDMIVSQLPPDP